MTAKGETYATLLVLPQIPAKTPPATAEPSVCAQMYRTAVFVSQCTHVGTKMEKETHL